MNAKIINKFFESRGGIYAAGAVIGLCALAPGLFRLRSAMWQPPAVLGWLLLVLAAIGAVMLTALSWRKNEAGMIAALPMVPLVGISSAMALFLGWPPVLEATGLPTVLAPAAGAVFALLGWSLAGTLCRDFLKPGDWNQSSFGELQPRITQIRAALEKSEPQGLAFAGQTTETEESKSRWLSVKRQYEEIENGFSNPEAALSWVMATGYISQWKRLHRAEEALLQVQSEEDVISEAVNDESRLIGSKIENAAELLAKLRRAVVTLSPAAIRYLKLTAEEKTLLELPQTPSAPGRHDTGGTGESRNQEQGNAPVVSGKGGSGPASQGGTLATLLTTPADPNAAVLTLAQAQTDLSSQRAGLQAPDPQPGGSGSDPAQTAAGKRLAISVLRVVRSTINQYQDDLYEGLVVNRNVTWKTAVLTGLAAFGLLSIAMIAGASRTAIVAGVVFYCVGGTVGLLARLRGELQEHKDVADYGLSHARLYAMPLFCGLAAIGGVIVTAALPITNDLFAWGTPSTQATQGKQTAPPIQANASNDLASASAKPPLTESTAAAGKSSSNGPSQDQSPGASPAKAAKDTPSLVEVFDLTRKPPMGLLLAILFGLTPELLFGRLQQQTEALKGAIRAVDSSQGTKR